MTQTADTAAQAHVGDPAGASQSDVAAQTGRQNSAENAQATRTIEERYGRGRRRSIDKRLGWIVGGGAVLAGLAFLLFSGWQNANNVEFRDLAYSVDSDREVTVSYEVTAPPQARVACTLEALSTSYATVGAKTLEFEPSEQRTRRFEQTLSTTYPATTGTVRSCWVVTESE